MSRNLLPLSVTAALMGGTALADVPSVAVDIAPIHSLVARVMDGVGTPDLIIPAGASPHGYSLRPSEAAALQNADIVFWMGHDLSPWLEDAVETLAEDAAVTELLDADGITLLDFRENAAFEAHDHGDHEDHDDHDHEEHAEGEHDDHDHEEHDDDHDHEEHAEGEHDDHDHDEHGDDHDHDHDHEDHDDHDHEEHDHEDHAGDDDHDHDHDHEDHDDHEHDHDHDEHADHEDHDHDEHDHDDHAGHDHGDHDPHAWLSPENAAVWLNVIAAQLSTADPENAGTYFANAAAAGEELEVLSAEINGILEPVRGMTFVVFHDAYQYFEQSFDFPASGAISLSDASDPSPARIAEIQARVQDEGVTCVLSEPQFNPGLVATVLDGTEANTGVLDPLGSDLEAGADLYGNMLRNLATTLADCL